MTSFPFCFFTVRGSVAAGMICNDVPKHRERSALEEWSFALFISSSGNSSSQSSTVSRNFPLICMYVMYVCVYA